MPDPPPDPPAPCPTPCRTPRLPPGTPTGGHRPQPTSPDPMTDPMPDPPPPACRANWRTPRDRQLAARAPHRLFPPKGLPPPAPPAPPPAKSDQPTGTPPPPSGEAPPPAGGPPWLTTRRASRLARAVHPGSRRPDHPSPARAGPRHTPRRRRALPFSAPPRRLRGPSVRGRCPPTGPGPDIWPDLASLHTLRPHLGQFCSNTCSSVQKFLKKRDLLWGWTVHWDRPLFQAPHPPWSWMPDGLGQNGPCRAANWAPYLACHAVRVGPFSRSPAAAHRPRPHPSPLANWSPPLRISFKYKPCLVLPSSFGWGWFFFCRPSPSQLVPPTSNPFTKESLCLVLPYLSFFLVFWGVSALPSHYGRTPVNWSRPRPIRFAFSLSKVFPSFFFTKSSTLSTGGPLPPVDTRAGARRLNAPLQAPGAAGAPDGEV